MTLLCDISQIEIFHKNKTQADDEFDDTPYARFRSGISGDRHSERSEESLYFSRSTVDTTGKIQGSVRSAQDDGHFNDYIFAGNALNTDPSTSPFGLRSG